MTMSCNHKKTDKQERQDIRCPHCGDMLQRSFGFKESDIEVHKTREKVVGHRFHEKKCDRCNRMYYWVSK